MKEIKLRSICPEVLITLNNLGNCEVEESEDSVSVRFDRVPGASRERSEDDGASSDARGTTKE